MNGITELVLSMAINTIEHKQLSIEKQLEILDKAVEDNEIDTGRAEELRELLTKSRDGMLQELSMWKDYVNKIK